MNFFVKSFHPAAICISSPATTSPPQLDPAPAVHPKTMIACLNAARHKHIQIKFAQMGYGFHGHVEHLIEIAIVNCPIIPHRNHVATHQARKCVGIIGFDQLFHLKGSFHDLPED